MSCGYICTTTTIVNLPQGPGPVVTVHHASSLALTGDNVIIAIVIAFMLVSVGLFLVGVARNY